MIDTINKYTYNNPIPGSTFKEFQEFIDNNSKPLELNIRKNWGDKPEKYKFDKKIKLDKFVKLFLEDLQPNANTVHKDSGKAQSHFAAYRSLVDIYRICKNYYPDCTLLEVKNAIWKKRTGCHMSICSGVKRQVFHKNSYSNAGIHRKTGFKWIKDAKTEFGGLTVSELKKLDK